MSTTEEPDYIRAHKHCTNNRIELAQSEYCGCFFCLEIYSPTQIEDWLDEGSGTAFCAKCYIDSVIGSKSGFLISKAFLLKMHDYWFNGIALPSFSSTEPPAYN